MSGWLPEDRSVACLPLGRPWHGYTMPLNSFRAQGRAKWPPSRQLNQSSQSMGPEPRTQPGPSSTASLGHHLLRKVAPACRIAGRLLEDHAVDHRRVPDSSRGQVPKRRQEAGWHQLQQASSSICCCLVISAQVPWRRAKSAVQKHSPGCNIQKMHCLRWKVRL